MREPEDPISSVSTTRTTLRLINIIYELEGARIAEIANRLDISTSTVHRHLNTLLNEGWIVKDGGEYNLSYIHLTYGGYLRNQILGRDLIEQKVTQLSNKTKERAQFIVEESGERVYVYSRSGEDAVDMDTAIGKRRPLHSSAAGKAILAEMAKENVLGIIRERGLKKMTENTITEKDQLLSELQEIHSRGYAFNDQESTNALRAVGASVHRPQDSVIGAISISGPAHRLKNEKFRETLPDLLLGSVNEIELKIKHNSSEIG